MGCRNPKTISGQKLYLLDVNPSGVREIELNFLNTNTVQLRLSLIANHNDFITNATTSITRVYTYSNDTLLVSGYINKVYIHTDDNGDFQTDNNVTFYHSSIISILGTAEAKRRFMKRMGNEETYKFYLSRMNPKLSGL